MNYGFYTLVACIACFSVLISRAAICDEQTIITDISIVTGCCFSTDHLGPDKLSEIRNRVASSAHAYNATAKQMFRDEGRARQILENGFLGNLIQLTSSADPSGARELALIAVSKLDVYSQSGQPVSTNHDRAAADVDQVRIAKRITDQRVQIQSLLKNINVSAAKDPAGQPAQ